MALIVRYPSLQSRGKWVYAVGTGTKLDPCVAFQSLDMSDVLLIIKYKKSATETKLHGYVDINIGHPIMGEDWYPVLSIFNAEIHGEWWALGETDVWKKYRLPYPLAFPLDLPEGRYYLKSSFYVDGTPNGEIVGGIYNERDQEIQPHITEAFMKAPPLGSLCITTVGNVGRWKIYHDVDWKNPGDVVSDLGLGHQLITFETVGGSKPDDIFVEVKENQTTEIEVSYP